MALKILITNDDGIEAKGLRLLTEFAKTLGEVVVAAPKTEQSAKSQSINIHTPFEIKKVSYMEGVTAYAVDSTPADCVRFSNIALGYRPDLVFSGINRGFNIGKDILYSATVGALFESVIVNPRQIALSTAPAMLEGAAKHLPEVYSYIENNHLFDFCPLLNVNIPENPVGIRITRQGERYYDDHFVYLGNDTYREEGYSVYREDTDFSIDTNAALHGYVSVTPMTVDRTDLAAFETLEKLNRI